MCVIYSVRYGVCRCIDESECGHLCIGCVCAICGLVCVMCCVFAVRERVSRCGWLPAALGLMARSTAYIEMSV